MIRPRGLSMGGRNVSAFIKLAILPLLQFSFDFNAKSPWRHFIKPDLRLPPIRRMRRSKPDINMSRVSIFLVCALDSNSTDAEKGYASRRLVGDASQCCDSLSHMREGAREVTLRCPLNFGDHTGSDGMRSDGAFRELPSACSSRSFNRSPTNSS